MSADCGKCRGEGVVERLATPDEVDNGCELGVAFDPCECTAIPVGVVEVAARAMHDSDLLIGGPSLRGPVELWHEQPESHREAYRRDAEAAVRAAVPHLRRAIAAQDDPSRVSARDFTLAFAPFPASVSPVQGRTEETPREER